MQIAKNKHLRVISQPLVFWRKNHTKCYCSAVQKKGSTHYDSGLLLEILDQHFLHRRRSVFMIMHSILGAVWIRWRHRVNIKKSHVGRAEQWVRKSVEEFDTVICEITTECSHHFDVLMVNCGSAFPYDISSEVWEFPYQHIQNLSIFSKWSVLKQEQVSRLLLKIFAIAICGFYKSSIRFCLI